MLYFAYTRVTKKEGEVAAFTNTNGVLPFGSTCSSVNRTCQANGQFNGDSNFKYAPSKCSVAGASNCTFNSTQVLHGNSVKAYKLDLLEPSGNCEASSNAEMRTCTNGTLSGSNTKSSCRIKAICTLDGVTRVEGLSADFTDTLTVPFGQTCTRKESRTCQSNGQYSAASTGFDKSFARCSTAAPVNCTFDGATLNHNASVIGFTSRYGSIGGDQCEQKQATQACYNGGLSNSAIISRTCSNRCDADNAIGIQSSATPNGSEGVVNYQTDCGCSFGSNSNYYSWTTQGLDHRGRYCFKKAVSCADPNHVLTSAGICKPQRRTCSVTGGSGEQFWDHSINDYGQCTNVSCGNVDDPNNFYAKVSNTQCEQVNNIYRFRRSFSGFGVAHHYHVAPKFGNSGDLYWINEGYVGKLFSNSGTNRVAIHSCMKGSPYYYAGRLSVECAGATNYGVMGYISTVPIAGVAERKLFSCSWYPGNLARKLTIATHENVPSECKNAWQANGGGYNYSSSNYKVMGYVP